MDFTEPPLPHVNPDVGNIRDGDVHECVVRYVGHRVQVCHRPRRGRKLIGLRDQSAGASDRLAGLQSTLDGPPS